MTLSVSRASRGANPARERCKNASERCSVIRASRFCGASSGSSFAGGSGGGGGSRSAGMKKAPPAVDDAGNGVKGRGINLGPGLCNMVRAGASGRRERPRSGPKRHWHGPKVNLAG